MSKRTRRKSWNNTEATEYKPRISLEHYDAFFVLLDNKFPGIVAKIYWSLMLKHAPEKAESLISAFYNNQITESYTYSQSPNYNSIICTRKRRLR